MIELDPEVLACMIAVEANTAYKLRGSGWKEPKRGTLGWPTCRSETFRE